ncbi:HAD family hydrolase [Actinobacillus succinogenes]|uniref:HAD-superfamily hydrolase, subfamily IA, variant 1 n=1 Tax=Actinobacillus succinogenes (strain ATCC 55618 / DSM 22257 / CCUG 43843 / 130Z) TaxID=339671 RepID=A6VQS5_ACTSZ|nr:HAD-IA family hydrolase [Actinobacillus succinogenes]ABR75322.1 HAD-superfamily hydrolase, subfamily IA, variant 1 [Actinobacillus succinogenes 130Z]PHI40288.1 HAD family hydrolase [Actinobacillus succinogenes]
MKFYRTLQPFKVISFDLDDTLYDNREVIRNANHEFLSRLRQASQISELNDEIWQAWKERAARQEPVLCEDVTAWRKLAMQQMLAHYGKNAEEIKHISYGVIQHFLQWRHKITIPSKSMAVLNLLKQRYRLAVITNGNVSPSRVGFNQFDVVFCGGLQGRAKPHRDLFHQTAEYFGIQPHEILHIGDDLVTDVQGAVQAGCQAGWVNLSDKNIREFNDATLLPTMEISDLVQLIELF